MTAFVLVGGLGTRLAELFPDQPKALVPVAGRAFVDRVLEGLARQGVDRVVLCAGHRGADVRAHVAARAQGAAPAVRVVEEPAPLGTAGALAYARAAVVHADETFLVLNGDTWAEFDCEALLALHRSLAADATLACYRVDDASARGTVEAADDGRLTAFREKADEGPAWVSGGVYALEPRALEGVPTDRATSLERDVFPRLLAQKRTLAAWRAPGRFWDMGTPEGLARAEQAFAHEGGGA
jgi:NDP-sugar pyrophosphorylase family protein